MNVCIFQTCQNGHHMGSWHVHVLLPGQVYRSKEAMDPFFSLFQVNPVLRWFASHVEGYTIEVGAALLLTH